MGGEKLAEIQSRLADLSGSAMTGQSDSGGVMISLRDVQPVDFDAFFEHQRDPLAIQMAAFKARDRETFFEHWSRILSDPAVIKKTIVAHGEVAGNIVSWMENDRREVG
jgi:environmental stress-induced protein Ves